MATQQAQLAAASEQLANAMMAVGLDRWPRFVAHTVVHARDPVTLAAVTKSLKPVPAAYAASGKPGSGSVGSGTSLAVGVENDPFLMPLEGGGEVMPHGGGAMPDMGPPSAGGDPGPPPAVEPLPLP